VPEQNDLAADRWTIPRTGKCLPRPNCHFSKILSPCGRKRPPRQIIVRFRQRLDISCPTSCVGN
jgi:hypothetical protein